MEWRMYYDRFYDWEESTQLRHLSALSNFGPSAEVCELACAFFEKKSANRLIRKALAAGVNFTAEEVLDLDGVVGEELMLPLIKSVPALEAEDLDELSFLLSKDDLVELAKKNRIRLDEFGYVMTAEDEAQEREFQRALEELRREEKALEKKQGQTVKAGRKKRGKTRRKRFWMSLRSLTRSVRRVLAGPPTTKEKIARQRAKARRNCPWWDK